MFDYLGIQEDDITYEANSPVGFHPGRSASIYAGQGEDKRLLGVLGQIHPKTQQELDLEDTYAAEILLEPLYDMTNDRVAYRVSITVKTGLE